MCNSNISFSHTHIHTPVNSTMLLPTCVYIRVHLLLQQQWLTFSSTGDNAPYHHKQSIVCDVWMSVCVSALKQGNLIFQILCCIQFKQQQQHHSFSHSVLVAQITSNKHTPRAAATHKNLLRNEKFRSFVCSCSTNKTLNFMPFALFVAAVKQKTIAKKPKHN